MATPLLSSQNYIYTQNPQTYTITTPTITTSLPDFRKFDSLLDFYNIDKSITKLVWNVTLEVNAKDEIQSVLIDLISIIDTPTRFGVGHYNSLKVINKDIIIILSTYPNYNKNLLLLNIQDNEVAGLICRHLIKHPEINNDIRISKTKQLQETGHMVTTKDANDILNMYIDNNGSWTYTGVINSNTTNSTTPLDNLIPT